MYVTHDPGDLPIQLEPTGKGFSGKEAPSVRRLALSLTVVLALSACSAAPEFTPLPSGADPPATCARADANGVIEISAIGVTWSAPCMVAPAGVAFVVRLTNNSSDNHKFAIFSNRAKTTAYMKGDVVAPQSTKDYPVAALAAGDYYFEDETHFEVMYGALYVR